MVRPGLVGLNSETHGLKRHRVANTAVWPLRSNVSTRKRTAAVPGTSIPGDPTSIHDAQPNEGDLLVRHVSLARVPSSSP